MKLLLILLRSSWISGLVSGLLGAFSGVANLGLIMLIHHALTGDPSEAGSLPYLFAGACVLVLITQVTAKCLLVQLSQATAARLRYELCTKIISAPLPTLESVGSHRLLAALINDVNAITSALSAFPAACANAFREPLRSSLENNSLWLFLIQRIQFPIAALVKLIRPNEV